MNSEIESLLAPMTEKLQSTLNQWIDEKEGKYSDRLKVISKALGKAGETLNEEGERDLARLFDQGSEGLNRIAEQVHGADAQTLLRELRSQSENNPAGVFAASLVTGFVASRVVRKSMEHSDIQAPELTSDSNRSENEGMTGGRLNSNESPGSTSSSDIAREGQGGESGPTFQEIANRSRASEHLQDQSTKH